MQAGFRVIKGQVAEKSPSAQFLIAVPAMVQGQLVEPGPEFVFVFQLVYLLEYGDEDVLAEILGFIFLLYVAESQIIYLSLVEHHQSIKGLLAPLAEGADKFGCFLVWHRDPLAPKARANFSV